MATHENEKTHPVSNLVKRARAVGLNDNATEAQVRDAENKINHGKPAGHPRLHPSNKFPEQSSSGDLIACWKGDDNNIYLKLFGDFSYEQSPFGERRHTGKTNKFDAMKVIEQVINAPEFEHSDRHLTLDSHNLDSSSR